MTFVRALWGGDEFWNDKSLYVRGLEKIRDDIRRCNHKFKAVNYVYGRENQKFLASLGHESVLLDERPIVWKPPAMWMHKLDVWRRAAKDHKEFVFIDWDIRQLLPLPEDFWETMRAKSDLQATLFMFYRGQCKEWRKEDVRKVPSASFVYCPDPAHVDGIIKVWEEHPTWTEQQAFALYLDNLYGGWIGSERWFHLHEPYCLKGYQCPCPEELLATKTHIFSIK